MVDGGGEFGIVGGPKVPGALKDEEDHAYTLELDRLCFMPSQGHTDENGYTIFRDDPADVALDMQPRTIHGVLDDHSQVSLLDAQMSSIADRCGVPPQRFTGHQRIVGAHISGLSAEVRGIRWVWNIQLPFSNSEGSHAVSGAVPGVLRAFLHQGSTGLEFKSNLPATIRALLMEVHAVCSPLVALWCGRRAPRVSQIEVQLEDGRWCSYIATVSGDPERIRSTNLLPFDELSLATFAKWIQLAQKVDPIPHMVVSAPNILQVDAQMLATALEGLDDRLRSRREKRFVPVDLAAVKRGKDRASQAFASVVNGLAEAEEAKKRFDDAVIPVGGFNYNDRVLRLASEVSRFAPGLCGPGPGGEAWASRVKKVRNAQSHQTLRGFTERDQALYFMVRTTAQWVLWLKLLLAAGADEDSLTLGLRTSRPFLYALANIDAEVKGHGVWDVEFSALTTFREAT